MMRNYVLYNAVEKDNLLQGMNKIQFVVYLDLFQCYFCTL